MTSVAEELAKPLSLELLNSSIPGRLAYVGLDGGPRAIPIAFFWNGSQVVMATLPKSAKVAALRANPRVALTIDTQEQWPPRVLLIRGSARLSHVDGIPQEYIEASRKVTPAAEFEAWEQGVRTLYSEMVLITVEPGWAKLLDFETTVPKSVEDAIAEYQSKQ